MSVPWKRSAELEWEELGNETLVVSPRSGARWSLNAMASEIWKLCDGSRSIDEIARALAKAAGGSLRVARAEFAAFCGALAAAGLLRAASRDGMTSRDRKGAELPRRLTAARASGSFNPSPAFRPLGLASGPRRRPSPRGNSGPG